MRHLGNVDVALLPIYGKFTMNISEAIDAVIVKHKIVIPMHIMKANPLEFNKKVEEISDIKVVPLEIGEVYQI